MIEKNQDLTLEELVSRINAVERLFATDDSNYAKKKTIGAILGFVYEEKRISDFG